MDMNFTPTVQTPPDGMMVIAVLPDGLVKPIPQKWTAPPVAPMAGIEAAVADSYGPDARVVTVPQQDFPQHHTVHYHEGQFTFTPVVQPPRQLAPLNVDDVLELIGHFSGEQASALEPPAPEPTPEPIDASIIGPLETLKAKIDAVRLHPEVAALLSEGETAPDAIERLTPDEDALLDLGSSLSEAALEEALRAIPRSAREKWMEGLHGTHADLRLKRGTDKENLQREAQVTRMMTLLGRVGEKR